MLTLFLEQRTLILIILAFVLVIQYALAVVALTKLFTLKPSKTKSIAWNIFIMIVFIIGPIAFLIYYKTKTKQTPDDTKPD